MTNPLVVTLLSKKGDVLRTTLWDSKEPFGIGHPFRWTLESTTTGIRVRDLSTLKVEEYKKEYINKNLIELTNESKRNDIFIKIHPYRYSDSNPSFSPVWLSTEGIHHPMDESLFKKAMQGSVLLVAALVAL
jgi:hypothetical protein